MCGWKQKGLRGGVREIAVTPFVGVWIETSKRLRNAGSHQVTPFVGVWIETSQQAWHMSPRFVTPFVGVWIETNKPALLGNAASVTRFVGVWIETYGRRACIERYPCHTLRECVD